MTNELQHTPKLRLLSAFLAAAMTLTTLPAAAFAADVTDYELAVNGKRVTSANATNILDDGKASYDAVTRTLTLSGDISVTDNAVNPFGKQLTVTGKSTVTGAQRDRYAGFYSGGEPIKVAADADITLDTFGFGINAMGADISGNMKICNAEYGVNGMGATVESGGKLIIQNADNAVSGGGANVHGTLEIDEAGTAVDGTTPMSIMCWMFWRMPLWWQTPNGTTAVLRSAAGSPMNIWTIPALMTTLFWTMQRNIWSMISSSCTVVSGPIPRGR